MIHTVRVAPLFRFLRNGGGVTGNYSPNKQSNVATVKKIFTSILVKFNIH
jgi:hypothetical protein